MLHLPSAAKICSATMTSQSLSPAASTYPSGPPRLESGGVACVRLHAPYLHVRQSIFRWLRGASHLLKAYLDRAAKVETRNVYPLSHESQQLSQAIYRFIIIRMPLTELDASPLLKGCRLRESNGAPSKSQGREEHCMHVDDVEKDSSKLVMPGMSFAEYAGRITVARRSRRRQRGVWSLYLQG